MKPTKKRRPKLAAAGFFGKRIDRLIQATGWRQKELQRHFGLSPKAIRRVRYGGRASVELALAIRSLEALYQEHLNALDQGLIIVRARSRYCFVDPPPDAIRRPADLQGIGAPTGLFARRKFV